MEEAYRLPITFLKHTPYHFFAPNGDSHWYIWDPSATGTSPVSPACFTGRQAGNQQTGHPTGTHTYKRYVSFFWRLSRSVGRAAAGRRFLTAGHTCRTVRYCTCAHTRPRHRDGSLSQAQNSWNTLSELHVVNIYISSKTGDQHVFERHL